MIMLKSGNFKFRTPSSSSKQGGRFDLPEVGGRMKRKPKGTGHSYSARFKRMRQEENLPGESALDKSGRVMGQGIEERVHLHSSKKMRPLKEKDVQCSKEVSDSRKDMVLGGKGIGKASKVDERINVKKTKQETSARNSGKDFVLGGKGIGKEASKAEERRNVKNTIQEISNEARCEDQDRIPLKQKIKVKDRSDGRDTYTYVDDTKKKCDKRMKMLNQKQMGKIEEFHRAWEDVFSELETDCKLKMAVIRSIYGDSSRAKEKLEIVGCELAKKRAEKNLEKDIKLKELEAEHRAAEDIARNGLNENPSIDLKVSLKNEGGIVLRTDEVGIVSSDTRIPDIVKQIKHSGERVTCDMQLELHDDIPLELTEENVNDSNLVNTSTNTPVERMAEANATDLPDAENSGEDERISRNQPASGESVVDEVQSVELHGDVELPETVANETANDANMEGLSTSTPNEVFGKGDDVIDLPDDKHFSHPKRFGIDELLEGIPAELAKTVALEIVDSVNPVELSADNSIEGFGEVGAVHLQDAFLNQRNTAGGTTIDIPLLDGEELETPKQTEAFQHPCPLLPLQVQEDQDAVSAEIQVHDSGKVDTSPSEVVTSELVDIMANSLSNIEQQACEEPAIETQSSSTFEVSTSKIFDAAITEQSSLKAHDHESSVLKDQVTSQIGVADMEIVDTAAPVSASEVVDTAETLQSIHELQERVEPVTETQSIEAAVSQNLSNAEEQVEDALTVINDVSVDIDVSNAGITGNLNPVHSHTDAPSIDSCSQLPSTDLECQNHNLESDSSEAVETLVLWDDPVPRLIEDALQLSNFCNVGPENQSSSATRVQTYASFQNNAAAESVSHLPSHQAAASNPLSLNFDPLQNELDRIHKETETLRKSHQEVMSGLKSECAKELEEAIAQVRRKYQLKTDDAIAQFRLKNNEIYQNRKKIVMNKLLADAFRFNCLNTQSAWPLVQQGSPSGSIQYHQQSFRPTPPNPQISFVVGQPMHQTSVPQATGFTGFLTSRNGQQQVPVSHSTILGPHRNQNSAAQFVPHATTPVTGQIGQAVQQMPVPYATRLGPVTNQNFAAQPLQVAQQLSATLSRLRAMNSDLSTSIPHFRDNIQPSSNFQASTPAAASSMATFNIQAYIQNLQLQQQQQQQLLQQTQVAPQLPLNNQNFQDLGYLPSLSRLNIHPLQVLGQNHQNICKSTSVFTHSSRSFGSLQDLTLIDLGDVQGNWNSCGGTATAIDLSDDD